MPWGAAKGLLGLTVGGMLLCRGTVSLGLPLEGEANKDGGLASLLGDFQVVSGCRPAYGCFDGFFFFRLISVSLIVFSMRFPARLDALLSASSLR